MSPKHQLAHANQVLGNLGETLLALVLDEAWPELEIPVDLDEGFLVVLGETYLLPQPVWKGRPLNGLHIQVAHTILFSDGGILAVGERAGGTIALSCQVVLIPAELLSVDLGVHLERTEGRVDDAPDDVIVLHFA